MIDVVDLPKEQLMKSATYLRYVDATGMCMRCKEWTGVLDPCCSATVSFEGGFLNSDDLWNQIDDELKKLAEPDYDAQAKDDKLTEE